MHDIRSGLVITTRHLSSMALYRTMPALQCSTVQRTSIWQRLPFSQLPGDVLRRKLIAKQCSALETKVSAKLTLTTFPTTQIASKAGLEHLLSWETSASTVVHTVSSSYSWVWLLPVWRTLPSSPSLTRAVDHNSGHHLSTYNADSADSAIHPIFYIPTTPPPPSVPSPDTW